MDKGSCVFPYHDKHDLWMYMGFMQYFGLDQSDLQDCKLAIDFLTRIKEIN